MQWQRRQSTHQQDTPGLVKDQGKTPQGGKPFEIILQLDCHKMFSREYNEPNTISSNNPITFRNMFPTSKYIIGSFSYLWSTMVNFSQQSNFNQTSQSHGGVVRATEGFQSLPWAYKPTIVVEFSLWRANNYNPETLKQMQASNPIISDLCELLLSSQP